MLMFKPVNLKRRSVLELMKWSFQLAEALLHTSQTVLFVFQAP